MPAFPCVVMWYLYAESLPASMPHTHAYTLALSGYIGCIPKEGKAGNAIFSFPPSPFFLWNIVWILSSGCSLLFLSPLPFYHSILIFPPFSLWQYTFYRSVLQSHMWSLRVQFIFLEYTCTRTVYSAMHPLVLLFLSFFLHNLSHTLTCWHSSPFPPFSLLGSLPWQRGQTSCDSAVVCRMHSAQGPQALDDNQPNLSHRFSTAWKIHRTICQT